MPVGDSVLPSDWKKIERWTVAVLRGVCVTCFFNSSVEIVASERTKEEKTMTSVAPDERYLAREDSLEYYIKFPTLNSMPSNGYNHNGHLPAAITAATDSSNFVYSDENVPIVLLLGWAGCQDRYLMKYSKIYEDRG